MRKMNFLNRLVMLVSALLITSGMYAQTSFQAWDMTTERPGVTDGIYCGNLTFTEKDITVEMWLNIPEANFKNDVTIASTRHIDNAGFSININNGQIRAFFLNTTSDKMPGRSDGVFLLYLPKEAFVDKWGHMAFVFSSTDNVVRSYLNGEVYEDMVKSTDPYEPYSIEWIGNLRPNGNNVGALRLGYWYEAPGKLYGKIADFRIWSVGRTDEEIKANYNKNLTGTYEDNPGLYLNYRFYTHERGFINDAYPDVAANKGWCNPEGGWNTYYKRETLSVLPQNLAIADGTLSWDSSAGEWEVSIFKKDDDSQVFIDSIAVNSIALNGLEELEGDITYYAKVRTLNNGVWSGQVTSDDFIKTTTGLSEIEKETTLYVRDGSLIVNAEKPQTLNIYTVSGQLVRSLDLVAGENVISGLAKGFYLANNQKIIIR